MSMEADPYVRCSKCGIRRFTESPCTILGCPLNGVLM